MRVQFRIALAHPVAGSFSAGQVADLPYHAASYLLSAGVVTEVDGLPETVEAATDTPPETAMAATPTRRRGARVG